MRIQSLLFSLLAWYVAATDICAARQFLGDANFERLTQASTGSTTGPWIVLFAGSDDAFAAWDSVEIALKGRVNVGIVPPVASAGLRERFSAFLGGHEKSGRVLYFRRGKLYLYDGDIEEEKVAAFATAGFLDGDEHEIPPPHGGASGHVAKLMKSMRMEYIVIFCVLGAGAGLIVYLLSNQGNGEGKKIR